MNIYLKKIDLFEENIDVALSRKNEQCEINSANISGIPAYTGFNNKPIAEKKQEIMDEKTKKVNIDEEMLNIDIETINNLNIVINDNDCSDSFLKKIYEILENDNFSFSTTKNSKNINKDNVCIITLDQQYVAGPGMVILAPYDNERKGNSDALALACDAAFEEKGFFTDGIECGKKGFRLGKNNEVLRRVPTATEDSVDVSKNSSLVTICLGTENTDAKEVALALENALGRYSLYIESNNTKKDLIYRATYYDTLESLADKYDTSVNYIKLMNSISKYELEGDEAIKDPCVEKIKEFDSNVSLNIVKDNNKSHVR